MNRKEIIRAMRSACDKDKVDAWINDFWTITQEELERFAALVAAAERERYIKIMQMIDTHYSGSLDYQPPYVKAARQVLDVIDWPNA